MKMIFDMLQLSTTLSPEFENCRIVRLLHVCIPNHNIDINYIEISTNTTEHTDLAVIYAPFTHTHKLEKSSRIQDIKSMANDKNIVHNIKNAYTIIGFRWPEIPLYPAEQHFIN